MKLKILFWSCEKVTDNCIEEWLYGDEGEEINDDAIICIIAEEKKIDETADLNDETEKIILHAEGTTVLDVALCYIEQQSDVLPYDILFLKSLRDNATRKRLSAKK